MSNDVLNKKTYITNHDYMSFTRFSRFMSCEAAAAAGFKEPSSTAMLIGSYVDSYFSKEMDDFRAEHPEIFNSKTGALKSDFVMADELIKRIESDPTMMYYMSGEKQVIMTGVINGVKFKIKIDSYMVGQFIVDLKVMKDFKPVWTSYGKTNFVEAFNYDIELAIFQEIVWQNTGSRLPCYICGITKESSSDVAIFEIPQEQLDKALELVKNNITRIKDILDGKVNPHRCGVCSYCRGTKKAMVLNYNTAGLNGDELRELGIECDDPLKEQKEGE